jgi:alpha/beta superfamily hydrolase
MQMLAVDPRRVAVAGYSFGARIALEVGAADERIQALVGISPPLSRGGVEVLKGCAKPTLLIAGSEDHLVPPDQLVAAAERFLPAPSQWIVVPGADHFWGYAYAEPGRKAAEFLAHTHRSARGEEQ